MLTESWQQLSRKITQNIVKHCLLMKLKKGREAIRRSCLIRWPVAWENETMFSKTRGAFTEAATRGVL